MSTVYISKNSQKGVSIFLALSVLSVFLGISLGLSAILLSQLRTTNKAGLSIVAFHAADSGLEWVLWRHSECIGTEPISVECLSPCVIEQDGDGGDDICLLESGYYGDVLDSGAEYELEFERDLNDVGGEATSTGIYRGTRRSAHADYD